MNRKEPKDLTAFVPKVVLDWPIGATCQQIEGSLVHVDISGFTAMSERFARKGKVGSEEVAAVLNSTFTELLTVSAAEGADLLKFGGDALLLLFRDEGHELRSCRAAAIMRTKLRSIGRIATPAGNVRLRMSVGVHSGWLDLFLVGGSHSELILAGPGASSVIAAEESASANEILLSRNTASRIPPNLVGQAKGPGNLLTGTPTDGSSTFSIESPLDVAGSERFVPTGLRDVVGTPAGEGEHRTITVGFVHFSGSDRMLASQGPDALWSELDTLVRTAQEITHEYGITFLATDIDRDGGKIILTAGAPIATGSDEEGMLRAVRSIADRSFGLEVQIGVNRGPAFAGDVGAPFRRTYTVIGDAVNLAARVMARAGHNEILATREVIQGSETTFELAELEPFQVKGKAQPIEAWRIGRPLGHRTRVPDTDLPLIGRDNELGQAMQVLEGGLPSGLIDLIGPGGIGKSRIIREIQHRLPDFAWSFSSCDKYETATPYFPYQRLLREVLGIPLEIPDREASSLLSDLVRRRVPGLLAWLPLIGTVMAIPTPATAETERLAPQYRKPRLHETIATLLDETISGPAGLIIEDAHWMDSASEELTAQLGAFGRNRAWTIILARRQGDNEFDVPNQVSIQIEPLPIASAADLAQRALESAPLLQHQVDRIVARAGGNPLFLLELVTTPGADSDELPNDIDALVMARIDRLDPSARKLLRYASAVGSSFDADLLTEIIADEVPEVAEQDVWKGLSEFVVPRSTGEIRFRQEIFHEVAYAGLPYRTRRTLHNKIGLALERRSGAEVEQVAERLAIHFTRAEVYDKAYHYAVTAGDRARQRYGHAEAADSYGVALRAARHLNLDNHEVGGISELLGDSSEVAGLYKQADKAYETAKRLVESAGMTEAGARLMRKRGQLCEKRSAYVQALRWFTRGLTLLDETATESIEQVELQLAYAGVRYRQGKFAETIRWAERAIPEARRHEDRNSEAHGYSLLGLARSLMGDPSTAMEYLREALDLYRSVGNLLGEADVLNNLGRTDYESGEWDLASARWKQCTEVRQKAGDVVGAAMAENNMAIVSADQGKLKEAELLFHRVRRVLRAAGFSLGVTVVTLNLGHVAAVAGEFETAEVLLDEALQELRASGAAEAWIVQAQVYRAEGLLLRGDFKEAGEAAAELLESMKKTRGTDEFRALALRILGHSQKDAGNVEGALVSFQDGLAVAREMGPNCQTALLLRALADLPQSPDIDRQRMRQEADSLLSRLGVVSVPVVPEPT